MTDNVSHGTTDCLSAITGFTSLRPEITDLTPIIPLHRMSAIPVTMSLEPEITDMKHPETPLMSAAQLLQVEQLGTSLARLRQARRVRQADAAARAGMARSTAALIEKGDPGRTLGQVLRYMDAIAPGVTLVTLLQGTDPSLLALEASERVKRVRRSAARDLKNLDF